MKLNFWQILGGLLLLLGLIGLVYEKFVARPADTKMHMQDPTPATPATVPAASQPA